MNQPAGQKNCYVYLAKCADGNLYTGVSNNPGYRIKQHNSDRPGGARYTARRRPVRLVYIEPFESRDAALRREHEIKKFWSHDKEKLIESMTIEQESLLSKFVHYSQSI
jgi:putative endonuclease